MSKHHKRAASAELDALTLEDGALFHTVKGEPIELAAPLAPLADSHGHLTHFRSHDPAMALARAAVVGVRLLVVPLDTTGDARDAREALDRIARWEEGAVGCLELLRERVGLEPRRIEGFAYPESLEWPLALRFVGGTHPYGAPELDEEALHQLDILLSDPRCVGVGEIGLDVGPWSKLSIEEQVPAFRTQLRIAHEKGLPVELHLRDEEDGVHATAHDVALKVLIEEGVPEAGCDLHCYTSDADVMRPFVELGCHVAFGGASTFATNGAIREAASACPADLLLSETDSPYMAPVPVRGQECEPAMVTLTVAALAEAREAAGAGTPAETYRAFWENALSFFALS